MGFIREVPLQLNGYGLICANFERLHLVLSKVPNEFCIENVELESMIQTIIFILALVGDDPITPGEGRKVHSLSHICLQRERMPRTRSSTDILPDARILGLTVIIEFHELCRSPILHIDVDPRLREKIDISGYICEEYPVVCVIVSNLFPSCLIPELTFVTIGSLVKLLSPRVSDLHQSFTVAEPNGTEDGVGVALDKTC